MWLLLTRLARTACERCQAGETDEDVDDALDDGNTAENDVDNVPRLAADANKAPVYRTDEDKHPRELMHTAHTVIGHNAR